MSSARPPAWIGPRGAAGLAVLGVVAGALCAVLPWPPVVVLAVCVALAAVAADAVLVARLPLIERHIPERLMLARPAALTYTVEHRGRTRLRFAIYESPAARVQIALGAARGAVASQARTSVAIAILPRERGRTTFAPAFAWIESPLGIVRRRVRVGAPVEARILPDLSALERGGDLARRARALEAGLRRMRRTGTGSEFESLRAYASGDAFRSIDWKASARRGRIMVTRYEVERSQQIVVALDAGRLMAARLGDRRKLDYAVSAALGIASVARRADDRVGLHAFAATTLATLAPRSDPAHAAALTSALGLIVLFTDLFDPVASSAVLGSLALLAPHHLVLVVLMNDAAIASARARMPQTVTDVYRAGVATQLANERDRAVRQLRERGIGVVDVPAAELSLALLDVYVDLKSRALL